MMENCKKKTFTSSKIRFLPLKTVIPFVFVKNENQKVSMYAIDFGLCDHI